MLRPIPESSARPLVEQVFHLQEALFRGLITLPSGKRWKNHPAIADWVSTLPLWRDIPSTAHARFGRTNSVWGGYVSKIAKANPVTKRAMNRVWLNHHRAAALYRDKSRESLTMPTWDKSPAWRALADLMSDFYDAALGQSDFLLPGGNVINGSVFRKGYESASIMPCPYWDCELTRDAIDLDHFLPRSDFPFLSVSPDNLVPCHKAPNGPSHKHKKIPLDLPPRKNGSRTARSWFHPRWRPAFGKVDVSISRLPGSTPKAHLFARNRRWAPHVRHFDSLVNLQAHWCEILTSNWPRDVSEVSDRMVKDRLTVKAVLKQFAKPSASGIYRSPYELLNQRKYSFYLGDRGTLTEIENQAKSLAARFRPN